MGTKQGLADEVTLKWASDRTYIEGLLLGGFLGGAGSLELPDLVLDVVGLGAHVVNHLALKFLDLLLVGVAAHQTEEFNVVVEKHIYTKAKKSISDCTIRKHVKRLLIVHQAS